MGKIFQWRDWDYYKQHKEVTHNGNNTGTEMLHHLSTVLLLFHLQAQILSLTQLWMAMNVNLTWDIEGAL